MFKTAVLTSETTRSSFFFKSLSLNFGHQIRTNGSIPLVANKDECGFGCRQLTIDSSPLRTRTTFVEYLSLKFKKNKYHITKITDIR